VPGGSGQLLPTLRHASGPDKIQLRRRPPGQSKILVVCQGFSELLGGPLAHLPRTAPYKVAPLPPAPSGAPSWTVSTVTGLASAGLLGRMLALPFALSVAPIRTMVLARHYVGWDDSPRPQTLHGPRRR
jgi:hypothetical protein